MRTFSLTAFSAFVFLLSVVKGAAIQFPTNLVVPDVIGVNIHFLNPQPGEMEMIADSGFKWVRMDFSWSDIEKKKGVYELSPYERLLRVCDKNHVRVMAIFDYANPLYDSDASPHSDEGIAAFVKWALATVKHFKGRQILWEIYNEPNGFWRPKPDVNAYVKLAVAVGKAFKSEFPEELFCGPALSGTDAAWLEPCYKAGLLQYWDAVSVHPYGDEPPEKRGPHYKAVRALIDRYRPAGKTIPVLSGEWGYTVTRVGRETQGKYLAREILFNIASGIPLSIWYDWRDDGTNPNDGENNFGTVANAYRSNSVPVLEPKPAYLVAKTLMIRLSNFTFTNRLSTSDTNDFVLLFTRQARGKSETRIAAWTVGKSHETKVPFGGRGNVSVVNWTGEVQQPAGVTADDVSLILEDAPKYILRN